MGLLDRFRAQPRWKNASPAVRIAAVEELPLDQQDTLVSIAREDRDAGVRVAALKKILAPAVVAEIASADAEARVREEALSLLVDLACGAFEATEQAESLAALAGLTDVKYIVTVAREASSEAVARAALDRLQEPASIGSVARRAGIPAIRLAALGRLTDESEVVSVAARSEFRDVAVAAVERVSSRERLEEIAARGKNKSAAKRARARARELAPAADVAGEADAAAAPAALAAPTTPEAPAPAPAASPVGGEDVRRDRSAVALCQKVESLTRLGLDEGEAALDEIERAWRALAMPARHPLASRYQAGRVAAERALEQHLAERAERARLAQATAEAVALRRTLCDQADGLAGDDALTGLASVRASWAALPSCPDASEAARWDRRFVESCRSCEARHRRLLQQRAERERAARVCAELERLAGHGEFPRARGEWQALARAWRELAAGGFDDAALASRFAEAENRLRAREAEAREQQAREQQANLARLEALCAEVEGLVASGEPTLKQAERVLRDARSAIDDAGPLPTRPVRDAIVARLEEGAGKLFPKVQELRSLDEWQRWANAGVQEEICRRVEGLLQVEDLGLAARQLREAQAEWKQVAAAPRDQSQLLWARFKAASDAVRARCDGYFAQLAEQQASNQARKEALCQQAEALSNSTDWIRAADAIKALQADWKTVGPAPRALEKALWERFHAACDAFFTRRREDLARRKGEWAANLERKEALCARAEAVADTNEWQRGIEEIKGLQAEWKTIGPVRKHKADAIWQRFRAACDRFFERYQQRDQLTASAVLSEADSVLQELEGLRPPEGEARPAPDGLGTTIAGIRSRWLTIVSGLPRDRALRLGERYFRALSAVVETWPAAFAGTDLDPEANTRKMEALCVDVEQLLGADTEAAGVPSGEETPATLLARQLREALASNTIAGRQDESARWKAALEQVRAAQSAWRRIGPVPEAAGRILNARFQAACARATEKAAASRRGPGGPARP